MPSKFDEVFKKFSSKGYRVLALAYKDIDNEVKANKYSRKEAEIDLTLIGFVVYESPLKSDTKHYIDDLRKAHY